MPDVAAPDRRDLVSAPQLTAAAIRWALVPFPPDDPLTMSHDELLVAALGDAEVYRMLAQRAIHALHNLTVARDRLREQHHRLVDDYRVLRESVLREDARPAT